jgi:hypothetical protein
MAENFKIFIQTVDDKDIFLLRDEQVIDWTYNQSPFKTKKEEDKWGRQLMRKKRQDLPFEKKWSGMFGEAIFSEACKLMKKQCIKFPGIRDGNKMRHPDFQAGKSLVEIKTQTYKTDGTACEKIIGSAYKYKNVPRLVGKPLLIYCIGAAELYSRENGYFDKNEPIIKLYAESYNVHYRSFSNLLYWISKHHLSSDLDSLN